MDEDRNIEIENGIDTQDVLDDTEIAIDKLVKKKRMWTGIAVFWFIVWLLIIMYMFFGGVSHQDTIKPPEPTVTKEPEPEVQSISVQEYIIKAVDLSPDYTGNCFVDIEFDETEGYVFANINDDDLRPYGESCVVTYTIEAGDDNFVAERTDENVLFTSSDKSFDSLTGTTTLAVFKHYDDSKVAQQTDKDYDSQWVRVVKDYYTDPTVIKGVGVIVSDAGSIANGVSTLEARINDLQDNGCLQGEVSGDTVNETFYTIDKLSFEEYANLVGECFNTKGYIVSSTDEGDVLFTKSSDGGISIKADELKEGDILVFFSLDRYCFTDGTAGMYSKVLGGTFEGEVFYK